MMTDILAEKKVSIMIALNLLLILFVALLATSGYSYWIPENDESDGMERVIGGRDAIDGQFPYAIALYKDGGFICTASLISPNTVLTAAHCVVSRIGITGAANSFHGMVGRADRRLGQRIDFSGVTPHPNYRAGRMDHDIAVMRLRIAVTVNDTLRPICIARSSTQLDQYNNATAMGWGSTTRLPITPDNLQFAAQRLLPHVLCVVRYQGSVTTRQLCADGFGTGVCFGDSGGPLAHINSQTPPVEVGVASFVRAVPGCGSVILSPAVFTRVSAYTDWILQTTGDRDICTI